MQNKIIGFHIPEPQNRHAILAEFHTRFLEIVIPVFVENDQHFDFRRCDHVDHVHLMLIGFAIRPNVIWSSITMLRKS